MEWLIVLGIFLLWGAIDSLIDHWAGKSELEREKIKLENDKLELELKILWKESGLDK